MIGSHSDIQGVQWPLVEPLERAVEAVLRNASPSWNVTIRGAESSLEVAAVSQGTYLTTRILADTHAPAKVFRWLTGLIAGQATRSHSAAV